MFTLTDGTKIHVRVTAPLIQRSLDKYNPNGDPIYVVQSGLLIKTSVPKAKEEDQTMTLFTTAQVATALSTSGYLPISQDTGTPVIIETSAEPYSKAAMLRLLRLRAGPVVRAPDDADEFLAWLEK